MNTFLVILLILLIGVALDLFDRYEARKELKELQFDKDRRREYIRRTYGK